MVTVLRSMAMQTKSRYSLTLNLTEKSTSDSKFLVRYPFRRNKDHTYSSHSNAILDASNLEMPSSTEQTFGIYELTERILLQLNDQVCILHFPSGALMDAKISYTN